MKKYYLFFMISIIITSISFCQEKKVYDLGYLVKAGDNAPDFTIREAGVTRNVIINRSGKIIFLTRLFDREEFDKMKKVIFAELVTK